MPTDADRDRTGHPRRADGGHLGHGPDARNRLVWDHFDTVKRGILYRSGQLNSDQLELAVARYGIKTVVNLQIPSDGVD